MALIEIHCCNFLHYLLLKNEIKYSLEQFRALDNGIKIKAFISNAQQQAVDSPEDLDRVLLKLNKIKGPDIKYEY